MMLGLILGCTSGGDEVSGIVPPPVDTDTSAADPEATDSGEADTGLRSPFADHNVLVIVVDDIGIESSACYESLIDAERPPQPTLSGLCAEGLTFTDAWGYPLCSPTRAAMMTGKYAWRTGIGRAVNHKTDLLSADEDTLPDLLPVTETAYIGKWHLVNDLSLLTHPNDLGWAHFSGTLGGAVEDYFSFDKVTDGEVSWVEDYATTEVVDDALAWLSAREGADPWVMVVGFQAAHTPYHVPPDTLIDQDALLGKDFSEDVTPLFHAMVEALDVEVGRLLSAVDREETVVIYVGDNGSTSETNQGVYALGQGKATLHQGGVHIPMVVAGPGIPTGEVSAMVHVVDLFATVLELTGVSPAEPYDSISMLPYLTDPDTPDIRQTALTELFGVDIPDDRGGRAARNKGYKLIRHFNGHDKLYHLPTDPTEEVNLLEDTLDASSNDAWSTLSAYLDQINHSANR